MHVFGGHAMDSFEDILGKGCNTVGMVEIGGPFRSMSARMDPLAPPLIHWR